MHDHTKRVLSFAAIGVTGLMIGMLMLWVMVEWMEFSSTIANAVQLLITIGINFVLNARFTWRDRATTLGSMMRFGSSRLGISVVVYLMFITLTSSFGVNYLLANAVSVIIGTGFNYLCGHFWVFRIRASEGVSVAG